MPIGSPFSLVLQLMVFPFGQTTIALAESEKHFLLLLRFCLCFALAFAIQIDLGI
jgi:hypothetical protein